MDRSVVGWRQDAEGQWVAELACGHRVHVRHDPPWQRRPWVLDARARAERLGTRFPCVRCDEPESDRLEFHAMSRLAEVLRYAEDRRAELLALVRGAGAADLERRPAPDRWSVAEVLDHLHRTENGIARMLARRIAEARAAGLPVETSTASMLGSLDQLRLTDRSRPIEAPDFVRPTPGATAAEALAGLDGSRLALHAALADAEGYALDDVVFPHAILGPLNAYQWILFVGQHEARHTAQIREMLSGTAAAG